MKNKGSIEDSVLQQWINEVMEGSMKYFSDNIRGSENQKKKNLTDLNDRMEVICRDIRRDNKEKRRIEEENRKKVIDKSFEVLL